MSLDPAPISDAIRASLQEAAQTPGQKLAARATTRHVGSKPKTTGPKTRSGGSAAFEQQHPRTRGGLWTVKAGADSSAVKRVQQRVGVKADGQYGPKTAAAVRSFQRAHGLTVDGVVGRQTAAAMRGDANAKNIGVGKLTDTDRRYLSRPPAGADGKRTVTRQNGMKQRVTAKGYDRLKAGGKIQKAK